MRNRRNKLSRDCNKNEVKVTKKKKLKIETAPTERGKDSKTKARLKVVDTKKKQNSTHMQYEGDIKEKDSKHAI